MHPVNREHRGPIDVQFAASRFWPSPMEMIMTVARNDNKLEVAVNRGLAAAMLSGVQAGVRSMIKEGVPPIIAARVLFNPDRRRSTDWRH